MKAVKDVVDQLGLNNIETIGERVEDYSKEHADEFSVVSARAVASLPALLELASPLMKQNARLILMKSHETEQYDIDRALEILGLELMTEREYKLSDNETFRRIYVFEKVKPHGKEIPRRTGLAQKRPLVG